MFIANCWRVDHFLGNRCNIFTLGAIIGVMIESIVESSLVVDPDELVARARVDAEALSDLYDRYYPRILVYCQRRLFCAHAAQDVTSDVFLAVAMKIPAFTGNTDTDFCRWIYRIATNQCNTYLRKHIRHQNNRSIIEREQASRNASQRSVEVDWPTLYRAIHQLGESYQSIITLRFFEKMSHKQIAEVLKMSSVTVRVKQYRALNKLKKILGTDFVNGGDS